MTELSGLSRSLKQRERALRRVSVTAAEPLQELLNEMLSVIHGNGTVYSFGNGGSASQSEHLTAELVGRYKRDRYPIRARSLTVDSSTVTAIANDYTFEDVFSRQVDAFVTSEDMVIGFSTSGKSPNVRQALEHAYLAGAKVWMFGGSASSSPQATHPWKTVHFEGSTAVIQEGHLLLVHVLCELIDTVLLGPEPSTDIGNPEILEATASEELSALAATETTWVNGCFDILHAGHLHLLAFAASFGLPLIVGVNSDQSVRRLKGDGRPIMNQVERTSAIAALPFVDAIVIFDETEPSRVLRLVKPSIVVKGGQYLERGMPEMNVLKEIDAQVVYHELSLPVSTSTIVNRLSKLGPGHG